MFRFLKSKKEKELIDQFKEFKSLEEKALLTEDEGILTVLESDMANIALIMKINSRKNDLVNKALLDKINEYGFPSCKEFIGYKNESFNENWKNEKKLSKEDYNELNLIYKKYRNKIKKAQKLVSLKKYLRKTSVIDDFYTIEELFIECKKEFSEKEYNVFLKSLDEIKIEFLNKAIFISKTIVYFKEELIENIEIIFRSNQKIELLNKEYKRNEINNLELYLSKRYLNSVSDIV